MNINNFEKIKELLVFDTEDDFYFIEILQRKKENPNIKSYSNSIKMYNIRSLEQLETKKAEIIKLCQVFNARAYIALNRRSFKQIAYKVLLKTAEQLEIGNYNKLNHIYKSCCSSWNKDPNKKWILDYDDYTLDDNKLKNIRYILNNCRPLGEKIITVLPTVNGIHIITKPFDTSQIVLNCELHKDRLTLLYYENMEC